MFRFAPPLLTLALAGAIFAVPGAPSRAAEIAPKPDDLKASLDKAHDFLKSKQGEDGGFLPRLGPGVTALVAAAPAKPGNPAARVVCRRGGQTAGGTCRFSLCSTSGKRGLLRGWL